MPDLEWYPEEFVDEVCPPSKPRPEGFFFFDGERWQLGYGPQVDDQVMEEDREVFNRVVEIGAVVNFISCERLPSAEVILKRSGEYELVSGEIPHQHNVVIVDHDSDTLHETLTDLLTAIKEDTDPFGVRSLIFADGDDTARVTLNFADWSDPVPLIFELKDGKPVVSQVPEQKN
ncbi:hypothetical protein SAMN05216337_1001196 [Bradyrhizobium brasilense]|uniref:Uncharacterized protein n=1 Tax=Bradyrhizobium brasilense TaxID=1419277 RepID=A0A1G6IPK0_9BRAD|nr:hypothetical protein [Bradyrhizobium brasilense]SDC07686.1 hypothetical protein SAMN05216337_1001196 [Bradyrhizobium brasilense]